MEEVPHVVKINLFVVHADKNVWNLALSVEIINYILLRQCVILKKKQPWAIREILRYEKIREKKKKDKIEKYKLQRWDAEWERMVAWQRIYTNSTGLVSIPREDNVFGGFYSNFDYSSIF